MGCGEAAPSAPKPTYYKGDVSHPSVDIKYFKDTRTGVCFAERQPNGSSDSYAFTTVPCNAVEAYYGVNSNTSVETNTNTGNTNEAIPTRKK